MLGWWLEGMWIDLLCGGNGRYGCWHEETGGKSLWTPAAKNRPKQVDKNHITHTQPAPVDNGRAVISHPPIKLKPDIIIIVIIKRSTIHATKRQSSPLSRIDKGVQTDLGHVGIRWGLWWNLDLDQKSIRRRKGNG